MADFDLTKLRPGSGDDSVAATCVAMVENALTPEAVERGFKMAGQGSLKQFFELKELPAISSLTWQEVFNNSADSNTIFNDPDVAGLLKGYTGWLKTLADAGTAAPAEMKNTVQFIDASSAVELGSSGATYNSTGFASLEWSPSGSHLLWNSGNAVFCSEATVAGDPSTLQAPTNLSLSVIPDYSTDVGSVSATGDGVNLYVSYQNTSSIQKIARLTLGTPFDLTTASFAESFEPAGYLNQNYDDTVVKVSPDGTKLNFLAFYVNAAWFGRAYTMSTPNNMSSRTEATVGSDFGPQIIMSGITNWTWSPDGTRFSVNSAGEFRCGTPWDLASLLPGQTFNASGGTEYWSVYPSLSAVVSSPVSVYDPLDPTKIQMVESSAAGPTAQFTWHEFTLGKWF